MKQSPPHKKASTGMPDILRTTLTLLITCVLVAGVLTAVHHLTWNRIAALGQEETETALRGVVNDPDSSQFTRVKATAAEIAAAAGYGTSLDDVYSVRNAGENGGFVFQITSSGTQGDLVLMVGVDEDGAVSGVTIFNSSEPAGTGVTGNDLLPNGTGVLDQFIGKTAADLPLTVGVNVEAVSGTAASCEAVTQGVNGALAAVSITS